MDAKVTAIEYDPNRSARIALLQYADGERRYIIAPDGVKVGDVLRSGADAEIKHGQRDAAGEHPGRHVRAQHRDAPRQGRADRAQRGHERAADGEGRQVRAAPPPVRRNPQHSRSNAWRRSAAVGNADHENISIGKAGRSRWLGIRPQSRGVVHEPGRPSARRRRREVAPGKSPPGLTVGLAHEGEEDPQAQEAVQQVHRETKEVSGMSRSLKKGPFVSIRLLEQVAALNKSNQKKVIKTWSRASTDHAGLRRPYVRRAQREQVHPGVHPRRAWSGTSSASSPRRGCSAAIPASRKKKRTTAAISHEGRMEARAINRYIGTSPRKMRLVIDLIRGKSRGRGAAHPPLLPEACVEGRGKGPAVGGRRTCRTRTRPGGWSRRTWW